MLAEGGLERLVAVSSAMEPGLRRNGVWALQNLAHAAPLPVKASLLAALSWPAASALLSDPEPEIQVGCQTPPHSCCAPTFTDQRVSFTSSAWKGRRSTDEVLFVASSSPFLLAAHLSFAFCLVLSC